ncbi:MAG TPA: methyltransferase domain-containing protein [Acidimicrobiia bacterium]|nr:methyltransferase domain-containing protein [Acidimicrobiia bacterium]
MTNADAWDRIASRAQDDDPLPDVVRYGGAIASERDLRLIGDVTGKRVVDLGCGRGDNAIVLALAGAHVIGVDVSRGQLARLQRRAEQAETKVETHRSDAADLAFLRADSIDLALSTGAIEHVEDLDRFFRQVHRVLRPGAAFVCSSPHPVALCIGRDHAHPGALPLGALEVRRSYFASGPITLDHDGEPVTLWPRTIAEIFASLHRAGFRVDTLLEPEPVATADTGPTIPPILLWRARKEGI